MADGRVAAIGTRAAVRRRVPDAAVMDCAGDVVLPGLIDAHLHLTALAAHHAQLDCAASPDLPALLAAIAAHARTLPLDAWVRGDGLDEGILGRLPTAAELDAAASGRPVRLRHRSRHASVLGRAGLARVAACGAVPRRALAAAGLVAGREEAITRVLGPLPPAAFADGMARAARELLACGITTVADATPRRRADLAPLRAAMARGDLPLRVVAMRAPGTPAWPADGRLLPGPVKLMVHEDGTRLRPAPAVLARRIAAAAARGDAVAVHCLGAGTLAAALAAFAAVPRRRSGPPHRLEHVAECPPPLVAHIARLRLAVVTNPAFVALRGDAYLAETPAAAHAWLYRARSLVAAGVLVAGASDAPIAPPRPWPGMAAARARRTRAGHRLGVGERLGARAALALWTDAAARVLDLPLLGRLRPGAPADLIVVDRDPLRSSPEALAATRVRLTMAAGVPAWRA